MQLFAWIGEDEFGSGEVGLKQAIVPAGLIPLVATRLEKLNQLAIVAQLQAQADLSGKSIRLIVADERATVLTLNPRTKK